MGPAQVRRHAPECEHLAAREVALAVQAAQGDHHRAVVDAADDAREFVGTEDPA